MEGEGQQEVLILPPVSFHQKKEKKKKRKKKSLDMIKLEMDVTLCTT